MAHICPNCEEGFRLFRQGSWHFRLFTVVSAVLNFVDEGILPLSLIISNSLS